MTDLEKALIYLLPQGGWVINIIEGKELITYDDSSIKFTKIQLTEATKKWEKGNLRKIRNEKLKDCDWTQLPDSPLSEHKKQEWSDYRQSLRDITESQSVYDESVFPEMPE